ncbi:hypothetical protein EJB05_32485 [Eragrostis curvula]|uniref:Uncharacterized protein n=1 Tax=Eragrostis curvula TaxID=38414 RepID=A0A5J9UHK7_9POAL|nr:hypothetical protein EJB05_32485 [Eragrostis curvula]
MAAAFSIRAYAESMRATTAADFGPFAFAVRDLPPMEVRQFRWWEDELAAIKASEEEEEEGAAPGRGRAPKKRSISDLFAAAPPVDPSGSGGAARVGEDDDEVLGVIMRRTKELRRKRRVDAVAAAAAAALTATAEAETSSAGEARETEANSAREKELDKAYLLDELDNPEASEEPEAEQHISICKENTPDSKEKKHEKVDISQKNKVDKQKHVESRKATKVAKQRDLKKMLPLHSILKKYTKHTSVKMVKEKNRHSKRPGVIELCRKSVKRVKFSEANNVLGSSKIPQLESICKLFSDAMTSSSSSTDMSSEGEKYIAAESISSHMPEKALTKDKKANESTDLEKCCKLSKTGSSGLFDLNQALPESVELNDPYNSISERPNLDHTQDGTFSMDEQALDTGREKQKHATDLDIRTKGKSSCAQPNRTIQDSVQLQQSWCSMTLHHGVSQLSTGRELPSCQLREYNLSRSTKPSFHTEMNVQQEHLPAAGQTFRLMGKDLTVSATRVGYLAETAQKHTGPSDKDNLNRKMVLGLPRHGQPFLSLQAPSMPTVSGKSASIVHDSASNPASKRQAQFGYRTAHNFSQPLPTSSGDPSPCEDRFRGSANSEARRNVLLGYPPLPNQASAAFLQNLQAPWHSTRTESPSEPFVPAVTRHVTPSSDYHANLPQPYGVYSASSSSRPCEYMSFTLNNPAQTVQGVSGSRVSSALPARYADTGVARSVPENSNASSSNRGVLRSGPVKLSAGAKHILIPSESTVDDNAAPLYSRVSFGSRNGNMSAPQKKGADFHKL